MSNYLKPGQAYHKWVYLPFACLWGKPWEIPLVFCTIHDQQIEPL